MSQLNSCVVLVVVVIIVRDRYYSWVEQMKLGGAKVILATNPDSEAMAKLMPGLGIEGQFLVRSILLTPPSLLTPFVQVAGFDIRPMNVSPALLISRRASVAGIASGNARDAEDMLNFAVQHHIVPHVELFPHAQVAAAYDRMWSGQARFRVVIKY